MLFIKERGEDPSDLIMDLVERFYLLKYGLAAILTFPGMPNGELGSGRYTVKLLSSSVAEVRTRFWPLT